MAEGAAGGRLWTLSTVLASTAESTYDFDISRLFTILCLTLALGASSARAADLQVKGGRRVVHVADEAGVAYHPISADRPVQAVVHGPGKLKLGLRSQNAEGETEHAELQILVDRGDLLDLTLDGEAGGAFTGHPEIIPGKRVDRQIRIGEGPHTVSVKVISGAAVVAFEFERDAPELAPLEAAPLAASPLTASPLTAEPLAPAPAAAPTAPAPTAAAPAPTAATQEKAEPEPRTKSTIPYYIAGGAVLLGGGSLIAWGLGQSTYGNYKSTPEVRGGSLTNRGEILSQANNDIVWAQALGILAVAALAGAAVVWSF